MRINRLDVSDEPAGLLGEKRCHDAEHGVTEAADVQDVRALRRLAGHTIRRLGFSDLYQRRARSQK